MGDARENVQMDRTAMIKCKLLREMGQKHSLAEARSEASGREPGMTDEDKVLVGITSTAIIFPAVRTIIWWLLGI